MLVVITDDPAEVSESSGQVNPVLRSKPRRSRRIVPWDKEKDLGRRPVIAEGQNYAVGDNP